MVTHVGGIDSIAEATLNLPKIPGGKKLTYTQFDMPLTAIDDFAELGKTDPLFAKLDAACKKNRGMWCAEAEQILFDHFGVDFECGTYRLAGVSDVLAKAFPYGVS